MEFLTLKQIHEWSEDIRTAFGKLMENQTLAVRSNARQWQFFRLCFERTLGSIPDEWCALRGQQLAQIKFEVEDKLRRFYLRHGGPVDFVFSLIHKRDAARDQLVVESHYPETAGYYLLVRDRRDEGVPDHLGQGETRAYLEKIVASCIDAEFNAYQAMPDIDEAPLLRWFRRDGGAYRELVHNLTQLQRHGWVVSTPFNPSTKRLLAVNVKEIQGDEAIVRTTEYWYLRWWSTVEQQYRYPYRETSRHTYILIRTAEGWRVDENIQPSPRSNTPHRQRK
jgi:hypothetical protein